MDTISGTKKKKKGGKETKAELIQMRIVVSKPGSKKYTHSDYNEILRANGKARNEEEQSRFYDEDTLMMAKKIGETKTKSGKKIRINLDELQHYNRNCGYDMDDDFIDDTEAVDDGNFSSRKGRFYVGKGDVKDMNDLDDDDEESEEEEVIPEKPPKKKKFMQPPPQKKDKEKNGVEKPSRSSSDSDSEAEEQPVRRMAGAPPSKRLLAPPPAKKDPTPPKTMEPAKKKPSPPAVSSSSSQSSDIVCLDDEPPVKKQKLPEKPAPSTSSESNGSNGSSAPPPKGNNKGCAVTLLAKQICKQQEELKKKDTATSSASSDSLMETLKALRIKLSESLVKKGKIYQEKGLKSFDDATLIELFQYVELLKHQKSSENLELSIQHVAQSFGLTGAEVLKRMETTNMTDSLEWKLTQADLPFLTDAEINSISAQVKAWRSTKEITNSVLTKWLKEVNQQKMNADQARNKLFELIVGLPNVDKPQEAPVELPKHERSRKARMFLNQWVYLSRKYVTMILPKLKKPIPTDGFAKKQVTAVEFLKDHVKKKREQFEIKKARGDHPEDVQFMFSFNDPVLAAIHTYLEEVCDYSLSVGKLSTIVHSIDSLYKAVEGSIPQHIFYIELCRRLQKLTFLLVEEPIKSRLKAKGESVNRHQVVQNPKYQIKWPNGEEPSLRGLNSELQDFETSIMPPSKHVPPNSTSLSTPLRQSTTPNTAPKATTAPSADELKRQQSMNQILQVYLGKYLLGAGNSSSINISDASQCPISDEILLLIVTAVSTVGIGLPDQMAMFKNILCNVGQARMALSVAKQKGRTDLKLTSSDYQKIFEFFSTLDKTAARNKLKTLKIQEENTRKLEEKQKKEKEKLLEKEKKEQEKREEKERKEKEKREEKERKEREMKEMAEKKRKEEEDRLIAKARLMQQMEDQRRKKEAEEAVEKELERRAKLEKEEASALQGLEEDLLMDDYDFVTEQQSKVDEERKIREAQRATERENQIKLMRAQQLQRRKEDEVTVTPVPELEPPRQLEERPKEADFTPPSSSSFDNRRNPPKPSDSSSSNIDILSAAQEAADLDFPKPPEVQAPRPMSAMEKLASLRGRTMSADMKRERDLGSPSQHQQIVVNMQGNGSPYIAPTTPTTQQFFPSSSSQSYQDPMMTSHQQQQQQQNQYPQQPTFNSSPINHRLQNHSVNHQMGQMNQMNQIHQPQQQQPRMPSTSSSGNMYYPDVELREPNKRSMSMSQPLSHLPQQQPQHQSSPQNVQQQQFPINSYQSPVNNTHQMNNSSLMHTPHSNSSMVSQSPQFSSHPSPMSQQFHTPPSVGMLNHPMVPSPMAATQPLQHFNFPPQQQQIQQQQQMQRQISQQNMLMQQQQNMQNMQQQQHQMMHHQMNQHNYPPNNF